MADIHCPYSQDAVGNVFLHIGPPGDLPLRVTEPGPVIAGGDGTLWVLSLGSHDVGAFLKPLHRHPELVSLLRGNPRVEAAISAGTLAVA